MAERLADIDHAELLREAVRGALMEQGLLGARIDQIADLAVAAVLDHPAVALRVLGARYMEPSGWTDWRAGWRQLPFDGDGEPVEERDR